MPIDAKRLGAENYQGRIMLALRPDFLETTNIKQKDQVMIIYDDDQIIIRKQTRNEVIDIDIASYMQMSKEYKKFYEMVEKDIVEFVSGGRKGSVKIDNLLAEARAKLQGVEIDKKVFLKELSIYLREKGIRIVRSADLESLIFVAAAVDEVEDEETKSV